MTPRSSAESDVPVTMVRVQVPVDARSLPTFAGPVAAGDGPGVDTS